MKEKLKLRVKAAYRAIIRGISSVKINIKKIDSSYLLLLML